MKEVCLKHIDLRNKSGFQSASCQLFESHQSTDTSSSTAAELVGSDTMCNLRLTNEVGRKKSDFPCQLLDSRAHGIVKETKTKYSS